MSQMTTEQVAIHLNVLDVYLGTGIAAYNLGRLSAQHPEIEIRLKGGRFEIVWPQGSIHVGTYLLEPGQYDWETLLVTVAGGAP